MRYRSVHCSYMAILVLDRTITQRERSGCHMHCVGQRVPCVEEANAEIKILDKYIALQTDIAEFAKGTPVR